MYKVCNGSKATESASHHNHQCHPGAAIRTKARAMVSSIIYTQFDHNYWYLWGIINTIDLKIAFNHRT